jgi:hypothetical protein
MAVTATLAGLVRTKSARFGLALDRSTVSGARVAMCEWLTGRMCALNTKLCAVGFLATLKCFKNNALLMGFLSC